MLKLFVYLDLCRALLYCLYSLDISRMEEEYFWEERRRFQEEMDYFEWQRMQGRPGMPPPPPFGHAGGVRFSFTVELQCKKTFLWPPAKRA